MKSPSPLGAKLLLGSALFFISHPAMAGDSPAVDKKPDPEAPYQWISSGKNKTLKVSESKEIKGKNDKPVHLATVGKEITVTYFLPNALTKLEELEQLNHGLSVTLPGLAKLLPKATESPKFRRLYEAKAWQLAHGVAVDFHDYFDCATVLNLQDPTTGRRAVLFQSDMDTDTDGTDPTRFPKIEDYPAALADPDFQPILSYQWYDAKAPLNPLIDYYGKVGAAADKWRTQFEEKLNDLTNPLDPSERMIVKSFVRTSRQQAAIMKELVEKYSTSKDKLASLRSHVGEKDPFIVIPRGWVGGDDAHDIHIGDYALVICDGKVLPAIVGDSGPAYKCGEASLKLARVINPNASGLSGAVVGPGVTYIVFPKTGAQTPRGQLTLQIMHDMTEKFVKEIGGLGPGVVLNTWQDPTP